MNKTILIILLLLGEIAHAQIQGSVVDQYGEPIIGASVKILQEGEVSNIGTVTDFDGKWSLKVYLTDRQPSVQVRVSSMGFASKDVRITSTEPQRVALSPDQNVLNEVSIVQQRLSEKQQKSALTVESMDALAIKESPSVSFYDHLGTLKGVDLTSASIGFKIINTRGFNSTSPVRSLQLIDGVDNQSPGLNFALGNFLGANDLDIKRVDIIAGASSAFYGPNAFNGVISMETKNPFDYQGLMVEAKGGERQMGQVAFRWADALKDKKGK